MQNRFFQNFVILSSKKGEYILQQMEKNDKIILIKQGTYEIGLKTSLKEIPQIIHFFYKKIRLNENEIKNLTIDNNCKYNNNKFEHSNESIYIFHTIEILRKKILDMLKEDKQFEIGMCPEYSINENKEFRELYININGEGKIKDPQREIRDSLDNLISEFLKSSDNLKK